MCNVKTEMNEYKVNESNAMSALYPCQSSLDLVYFLASPIWR